MRACVKETGSAKLFSANITADDPAEMIARGKYVLSQFGPLAECCALLVDGYVAGGTAVTVARRNFPRQFLHYHHQEWEGMVQTTPIISGGMNALRLPAFFENL